MSNIIVYRNIDKFLDNLYQVNKYFLHLIRNLNYKPEDMPKVIQCTFKHNISAMPPLLINILLDEIVAILPEIEMFKQSDCKVIGVRIKRILNQLSDLKEAVNTYGLKQIKLSVKAQYYDKNTFDNVLETVGEWFNIGFLKENKSERTDNIVIDVLFNERELIGLIAELDSIKL